MLHTVDVAETIRRCEISGIGCGLASARRLMPEAGVASMEIGGGFAAFAGADSPFSQVYGIVTPVGADEVATITAFYETRGATPKVFVSPFADGSLALELAAGGYAPSEYENVLASDSFDGHAAYDEPSTSHRIWMHGPSHRHNHSRGRIRSSRPTRRLRE